MYISLNWLKEFVNIKKGTDAKKLGDLITVRTAEVEDVIIQADAYKNMVVGVVKRLKNHPGADKLSLAQTDIGKKEVQIVCGGTNLKEGMKVAVALPGARVRWHGEGELVELTEAKIRGEKSFGMICAGEEIGFPADQEGNIMDISRIDNPAGTPLADAFGLDDVIYEFDNKALTHRPDLWGVIGIAREIAAITGEKFSIKTPEVKIPTSGQKVEVDVKDPELCPRYMALKIDGIKVGPSPEWMQKRLKAVDHSVINNIVDITNYVMDEVGQPMHAFDTRNIDKGIIVRRAKKGEKITTLDEKEYKLDSTNLLIADHKKPIAVAGVMGGQFSGIADDTTSIILESANFDPVSIRKTSQKLGLRSDSSQRFEKSLDPVQTEHAILRAAELILELCPDAKIAGPITDIDNSSKKKIVTTLELGRLYSKIGKPIPSGKIIEILKKLEFTIKEQKAANLTVEVPSFRATKDIDIEDDVVEEIARMYGYENIPPILPALPTKVPRPHFERIFKHELRDILSLGCGYIETYNYSFYGEPEIENANLALSDHVELDNVLSSDQTHMRVSLIPNLLHALHEALKNEDSIKLYEIGRTYIKESKFMPREQKFIAGVVSPANFFEAKGDIETTLTRFGMSGILFEPPRELPPYAHPTKSAEIFANNEPIGYIFELHPAVAKNFDVPLVTCFEINFSHLTSIGKSARKYTEVPRFPSIDLDVSALFDKRQTYKQVRHAIEEAGKSVWKDRDNVIESVELFDLYEGDRIPADKKSMAFRVRLRASDRTLTDAEMTDVQKAVWNTLKSIGGEVRR